jgi:phage regulator Rha-like protein
MEKRALFVKKRKEMEEALAAYKKEKGNYFKMRMKCGQKIG